MRAYAAFSLSPRLFAETWFCSILAVGKSSVNVGTKVSLFSVYLADLGVNPEVVWLEEGVEKREPLSTAVRVGTDPGLRESVWKTTSL